MNRNVWLLFCCQALMNAVMSGQTVMSALIGHSLAVDKALNTLPMAIQMTATMTASIPASVVFARMGRKPGFWLGCAGSVAGSLIFALGVWTGNFETYCVGAACAGFGFGISQHMRFAGRRSGRRYRARNRQAHQYDAATADVSRHLYVPDYPAAD
jgi:MFS family permease